VEIAVAADVTFADLIADVRRRLSDNGNRIAGTPQQFNLTWWPSEPEPGDVLLSDRGVASDKFSSGRDVALGLKKIEDEFGAEVNAIHDSLVERGHVPRFAKWQRVRDVNAQSLYKSMNIRASALSLWEQIAFPIRRHGDYLYRVWAPREVLGGTPIIHPMHIDRFARAVASRMTQDSQELARLRSRLKLWKAIAGAGVVAILVLIWAWSKSS
jgi:hypothetical protein